MTRRRLLILTLVVLLTVTSLVAVWIMQMRRTQIGTEAAKTELAARNIRFSTEAFAKSVRDGDVEVVKLFLDAGMSPDSTDENGPIALMTAAIKNDSALAQVLIDHGANVNIQTKDGESPLMVAALMGATDTVRVLIKAGADLNAKDNRGETPLAHARSHSHTDVVNVLTAAGAKE